MTPVRSDMRSTSRRRIALVVLALLLAALFAYPGSGLLLGWSSTEDGGIHQFHTVVWGVHTGLVLSIGLFALLLRTGERVASWVKRQDHALLPEQASSPGVAWGAVAVLGGALFIAVAEFEARRDGATAGRH